MTSDDIAVTVPKLGRYTIDPAGSSLTFRTTHLFGLLPVRGTFPLRGGTVEVAEPLADSSVRAEIDAAGFHTGNAQRDSAVRSAKFLDTDRHPLITFTSDRVDAAAVSGTLTVRGVSRPVIVSITRAEGLGDAFTVQAATRIDRTEFGVTASRGMAGRHLELALEIRCVRG